MVETKAAVDRVTEISLSDLKRVVVRAAQYANRGIADLEVGCLSLREQGGGCPRHAVEIVHGLRRGSHGGKHAPLIKEFLAVQVRQDWHDPAIHRLAHSPTATWH